MEGQLDGVLRQARVGELRDRPLLAVLLFCHRSPPPCRPAPALALSHGCSVVF